MSKPMYIIAGVAIFAYMTSGGTKFTSVDAVFMVLTMLVGTVSFVLYLMQRPREM